MGPRSRCLSAGHDSDRACTGKRGRGGYVLRCQPRRQCGIQPAVDLSIEPVFWRPVAVVLFVIATGCGARTSVLDYTGDGVETTAEDAGVVDSGPIGCVELYGGGGGGEPNECQWYRGTEACRPEYTEGACPPHLGGGEVTGCCVSTSPNYVAAICNYYPHSAITKSECLMDAPTSNSWQMTPPP
jgi:hypothetical protein